MISDPSDIQLAEPFFDPRSYSRYNERWNPCEAIWDGVSTRLFCSKFGAPACRPYMTSPNDKYVHDVDRMRGLNSQWLYVVDFAPSDFINKLSTSYMLMMGLKFVVKINTRAGTKATVRLSDFLQSV
jgi:hypothetical protein